MTPEERTASFSLSHLLFLWPMMNQLFDGYDVVLTDSITPEYHCDCSKERVYKAIMSVGKAEIEDMIADGQPIEVGCHFCNKKYNFDIPDLQSMLV